MDVNDFIQLLRSKDFFHTKEFIPLHAPVFFGNEKKYLIDCIDSTFVSSVGKYVDKFEQMCAEYTGAKYAVSVVNGTAALHISLLLAGVESGDEVITQPLTFVATTNAISYINAKPVFVDVCRSTMGLSPESLKKFLEKNCKVIDGKCYNLKSEKWIKACVPMHTFGFPCDIIQIVKICDEYGIKVVEDSAESLGSFVEDKHTGTFGLLGTLSFNGNKTITCGGGGVILTDDAAIAKKAKHITTTAKVPHKWEYDHDMIGYNYRLTNLNAAVGCAQMEKLTEIIENKNSTAKKYESYFSDLAVTYVTGAKGTKVNNWLNAVIFENEKQRDHFLNTTNEQGVMTRPIWKLMNQLPMFKDCHCEDLSNAEWLEKRVVNIPSSVRK